jgi:hypothetical protein
VNIVKLNEPIRQFNTDRLGTLPAGSLAAPATPTGFAVASIGSTKQRASWNMVPITGGPAATYDLSSDGVNADIASGIVGLSYDITGLTASTAYNRYVRATNDTGSSAWSAVVAATTSSANDFLTRIETALTSMLIVPRIANGFWFDWSTSTTRDFAQSLPTATSAIGWVDLVPVEESVDAEAQCDFNGYHNKISVEIYSAAALATTSNNPKESCKQVCSKMLEDIKKLMGTNLGASSAAQQAFWDEVASVEYKRSTILWADKSADVMIPGWLKTEFTIGYVQRRAEPTQSGI